MLVLYLASFPAVFGMILIGLAFYSTIVIFGAPIDYQPDFSAFFSSSYFQTGLILVCVGIICSLFVGYGLSQVTFLLYDYLENNTYSSPFKLFS
ncbi:integral membrane protein [Streptococcus suis]|nr:integral membrane protein [Streptococcus suis]